MASFLQRIFRRPDYRSDVTQFIEKLKTEKPDLEAQQRADRAETALRDARARIVALEQSTSWRLTAPLRGVSRLAA